MAEDFPMHCAASNGDLEKVKHLIDLGVSMDSRDQYGRTPLLMAAHFGKKNVVDFLIQRGVQINSADNHNYTLLHGAALSGWLDVVKKVVEGGHVDVNAAMFDGDTPLKLAAARFQKGTVDFLIECGANVNYTDTNWTLLHSACNSGWMDVVQRLVESGGVDVNATSSNGETAIMQAADRGHKNIVDLLIKCGAQDPYTHEIRCFPSAHCEYLVNHRGRVNVLQRIRGMISRRIRERKNPAR